VRLPIPVQRLGYRAAYRVLRVYWWIFRPRSSGVKCVLTHCDEILLVRHTYGPRSWELPGGSRKRGEEAEVTATREIREELGLSVDRWQPLGRIEVVVDHHTDSLHCFQAEIGSPELVIDRGELAAARWFSKQSLPQPLGRYTSAILAKIDLLV
jgi:8-oxo-dGTP pyrophosphatase MutT (NUDIX family)